VGGRLGRGGRAVVSRDEEPPGMKSWMGRTQTGKIPRKIPRKRKDP